jgi:osmotically-inducible protein OsmY
MKINKYLIISCLCLIANISEGSYENERDLGLANKAKIIMLLKKGVPSANIKTHANKGSLQIAGYVNNKNEYAEVLKAINDCLEKDTNKIINNVKIHYAKNDPTEDKELEEHVIIHLKQANFPVKGISVLARGKHVMLSGFVDKKVNVNKATTLAKAVPGITQVDNYLLYK